jgi:twitching motility protein PilJ
MSVADQLQRTLKRDAPDSEMDSGLSISVPDASMFQPGSEVNAGHTQYGPQDLLLVPGAGLPAPVSDQISLPLLGARSAAQHRRLLSAVLLLSLLLLALLTFLGLRQSGQMAQQRDAAAAGQMQSQRLAKAVTQALVGNAKAFAEVGESSQVLVRSVRGLLDGDAATGLTAVDAVPRTLLDPVEPLVGRAEKNAASVLAQKKALTQAGPAAQALLRQTAPLMEAAQAIATLKAQHGAPATEVLVAGQLAMLVQRMGKTSAEFLGLDGVSPEAIDTLRKDVDTIALLASALLDGRADLGLTASTDVQVREKLLVLIKLFEDSKVQAQMLLTSLPGLTVARAAQVAILADSESVRLHLDELQLALSRQGTWSPVVLAVLVLALLLALASAAALAYVVLLDSRQRQALAESLQTEAQIREQEARALEQEARRVNAANQAAILRLMNELQLVAEGDLTQQATVTEDITGAIADSVNYTVEELRSLVGNVQSTVAKVAQTTSDVDETSTELLAASNEQLHEIRETGRSVVDMAGRINLVSGQAQESAAVARQSLQAAETGLQAVQSAIGGMNTLRDQIQDTAKRIKRLGESSQEIGEITDLISDITEQTNVLALNAAIQAASAGEAGRGFSVVAEEVQRLAERSADATRQIGALVKAIQTDTQDAVGAMERSTHGVVEGAKLSDNAGAALSEIDQVSRRLADLIAQISASTLQEANLANELADNIQHIFAVTEQTGEGTRSTASQVRELSKMAEELRQSVARFRIA